MQQDWTELLFNTTAINHFILRHPEYIPAGARCALTGADFPEDYYEPIYAEEIDEVWQLMMPVFNVTVPFAIAEDWSVITWTELASVYFFTWAAGDEKIPNIIDQINEGRRQAIRVKTLSGPGAFNLPH